MAGSDRTAVLGTRSLRIGWRRTVAVAIAAWAACLGSDLGAAEPGSPVRLKARTFVPAADVATLDRVVAGDARHVYLQLSAPFAPSIRGELRERGLDLLRYVPDDTWIGTITPEAAADPVVRTALRWVAEIDPDDKMPARFTDGNFGDWAVEPDGRIALKVRLHDDLGTPEGVAALAEARTRIAAIGAEIVSALPVFPGFVVRAQETDLPALAALDPVLWISEVPPAPEPENDGTRARVRADDVQAAPYGLSGQGVVVAVNDGGQLFPHLDFDLRLIVAESGAGVTSHGTHVAGTLGGSGVLSASQGGTDTEWRGVAPAVSLVSFDYFGDVIQEMRDGIVPYDIDVHHNSWGYGVSSGNCDVYGDYDFIAPELDSLVLGAAGKKLSIVFSGGNERDDGDCPLTDGGYGCVNPPKPAKNIIAVGASYSDTDGMTEFSSWGPVDDGRLKPDLIAPGCEEGGEEHIHSTLPDPLIYGGPSWCGTSMAAPVVSGAIALLLEARAALEDTTAAEPSTLKALLIATAIDLGNPAPDYAFGHGRIDVKRAAEALLGGTQPVVDVAHGESYDIPFHVAGDLLALNIAAVWDDPDGAPGAGPALVNDVDLVLLDPLANEVRPWVLDPADPAANAVRGVDSLNNVEHVTVASPAPGAWIARLIGTNIPEGPQRVSLAGIDITPPAAPDSFAVADTLDTSVALTWVDDRPIDYRGTLIVRSAGTVFWPGPTNGQAFLEGQNLSPTETVVYVRTEDHSTTPFVDQNLERNTNYVYRAYSFDDWRVFSPVATVEVTTFGASAVGSIADGLRFALQPARPNPALGRTTIEFSIPETGAVQLALFDPAGRLVRRLVSGRLEAGTHVRVWDGRDDRGHPAASGVYFYELRSGTARATRSLSWIR